VDAEGRSIHLSAEAIEITVLRRWKSPRSRADYPAQWRVRIPLLGMELTVTPNLDDQELMTPESTRVTYWEGSVGAGGRMSAVSSNGSKEVDAVGYVELTGYDKPLDALIPTASEK